MFRHKYNAQRTASNGVEFSSKAESARYAVLLKRQERGEIAKLECQPRFLLQPGFGVPGKKVRAIEYVADFRYEESGRTVVEDVKGMRTECYNMKRKMFLYLYGKEFLFREVKNGKQIDFLPHLST